MKQVVTNQRSGQLRVTEVPAPSLRPDGVLVASQASLISAGTERASLQLAQRSLAGKAMERPDLVQKVLDKLRRDGFWATLRSVRERLDREVPLGYSVAGEVLSVGRRASGFSIGQRVTCAGAGYANHAEINYVPRLLAVPVPDGVSDEAAAYATVGAIALQGIRNADCRVGETAVVLGLGLVGQLTVQLLAAAGCHVIALDLDPARAELALAGGATMIADPGAERLAEQVDAATRGLGADAVLITAATDSNRPVELAAELARDRARIVMVGVTGMDLPRRGYFAKELTFIVSRSYGPGRYDPQYEEAGQDYPAGHVRWTEGRNLQAFVDLVAAGRVRPQICTTHRFPIDRAEEAFELILTRREPHLGVILTYPPPRGVPDTERITLQPSTPPAPADTLGVSLIGCGGFARGVVLPELKRQPGLRLQGVVSASGLSARSTGARFGFAYCATDLAQLLADDQTGLVCILTPHDQHAEQVCQVLAAGKPAFVEKPLALDLSQLRSILEAHQRHPNGIQVGYNRRFAPLAVTLKRALADRGPITLQYRCNAGPLPPDHWVADPAQGGRILGEGCHLFDLFGYLTGARAQTVVAAGRPDDAHVAVSYDDGSTCTLMYTGSGPSSYSKERLEAFAGGAAFVLEDYRRLEVQRGRKVERHKLSRPDKGHRAQFAALVDALRSGSPMPTPLDSLIETSLVSLAAVRSLTDGGPVVIADLAAELGPTAAPPGPPVP